MSDLDTLNPITSAPAPLVGANELARASQTVNATALAPAPAQGGAAASGTGGASSLPTPEAPAQIGAGGDLGKWIGDAAKAFRRQMPTTWGDAAASAQPDVRRSSAIMRLREALAPKDVQTVEAPAPAAPVRQAPLPALPEFRPIPSPRYGGGVAGYGFEDGDNFFNLGNVDVGDAKAMGSIVESAKSMAEMMDDNSFWN